MDSHNDGFKVISLFEADAVAVGDPPLHWIPVRRRLGIGAFGMNAYTANRGEQVIEQHVESPGQEEIYVVLRGRMAFAVNDHQTDLGPGDAAYVADPTLRRGGTALEDETAVLAVGGWRDKAYNSLPWELIYLSAEAMSRGAWAEVIEILDREGGEHRGNAFICYRVACCRAQLGEHDAALAELKAAVKGRPELLDRASADGLLQPVRGLDGWPEVG